MMPAGHQFLEGRQIILAEFYRPTFYRNLIKATADSESVTVFMIPSVEIYSVTRERGNPDRLPPVGDPCVSHPDGGRTLDEAGTEKAGQATGMLLGAGIVYLLVLRFQAAQKAVQPLNWRSPSLRVRHPGREVKKLGVESRCDAVVLGLAYLLPALSVAGASLASP